MVLYQESMECDTLVKFVVSPKSADQGTSRNGTNSKILLN